MIAARLNAVGLAHVLVHSRARAGTQSADWVTAWASKVKAIVP
jgi:hypothetical protein